jgi:pyruvate kinase
MGKTRTEKLQRLIDELDSIVTRAEELEVLYADQLKVLHPEQVDSGRNLLHYLALRESDIRSLQADLAAEGLSSLGRSESHVLASVCAVRRAVRQMLGVDEACPRPAVTFREGPERIRKQTNELFGRKLRGSSVRVMVTLPIEAAHDYGLVLEMLRAGMNCARINCSTGSAEDWNRMIEHVHRARESTGRACRVFMDLSGPKIRTGGLVPGPRVAKIKPGVDERGRVEFPAALSFVPEGSTSRGGSGRRLPVSAEVFGALASGRTVEFQDTSGTVHSVVVDSAREAFATARCWSHAFVETGDPIRVRDEDGSTIAEGSFGTLPEVQPHLYLAVGDTLVIHKDPRPGENAQGAEDGTDGTPAHVACMMPDILDRVEVGHEVVLDDGKFRGRVREAHPGEIHMEITHAAPGGARLKPFKGINVPESKTGLFGLTEKDRRDLPFVVEHADAVNVSFINHPDDVEDLIDELESAGAGHLGLILKIETLMGVRNLPGILLAAMEWPSVGVMIARGDLAVEVGWTELARTQEEILWLCEAAHFPVIWATEVLANLAKKGIPSRGEISDVVMAERAECVMLNKGPHITTTIETLDAILASMQDYQTKKVTLLPALDLEMPDPDEVGRSIGDRQWRWLEP